MKVMTLRIAVRVATGFAAFLQVPNCAWALPQRETLVYAVQAKEHAIDTDEREDWAEALRRFRTADAVESTAQVKYEIGLAAAHLSDDIEAIEAYESALNLGLAGGAKQKALAFLDQAWRRVARVWFIGPAGCEVSISGVMRTTLPHSEPLAVLPGVVAIDGWLAPDTHLKQEVSLAPGQHAMIELKEDSRVATAGTLSPPRPPASESPSLLHDQLRSGSARKPSLAAQVQRERPDFAQLGVESRLLIGTGTTLGLIGLVFVPVANAKIASGRETLALNCAVQVDGPDFCAHAKPAGWETAQSASDSIATWKAARTVAWTSLGIGMAAAASGLLLYWLKQPHQETMVSLPQVSLDRNSVSLSMNRSF